MNRKINLDKIDDLVTTQSPLFQQRNMSHFDYLIIILQR